MNLRWRQLLESPRNLMWIWGGYTCLKLCAYRIGMLQKSYWKTKNVHRQIMNCLPKRSAKSFKGRRVTQNPFRSAKISFFSGRYSHGGAQRHPKIVTKAYPKPNRCIALWQLPADISYMLDLGSPRGGFGKQIGALPKSLLHACGQSDESLVFQGCPQRFTSFW